MTNEEKIAQSNGLPKWPQMYTTGKPVTIEQAKEIIRRTDTFIAGWGGNDHDFDERTSAALRILRYSDVDCSYDQFDAYRNEWQRQWGYLQTEYVSNSWISACFIGGPHGWMHPDGQIGFLDNTTRAIFGRGYAAEPDVLIEQLRKDGAIAAADTLLLTVPNQLGVAYNAHVIEAILTTVAPALGWR